MPSNFNNPAPAPIAPGPNTYPTNDPLNPIRPPNLSGNPSNFPNDLLSSSTNNRYPQPEPISQPIMNRPSGHVDKIIPNRRPPAPPVRIDTCIVGDDSTCEIEKHEVCRTHLGVSSCDCKPGYGRVNHRKACKSKRFLNVCPTLMC